MGLFKKIFGKSKRGKSSDHSLENHSQTDSSNHGNESESEEESDNRQPETPEENTRNENSNWVAPTSPDRESPPHRDSHTYEPGYQPWSSYGTSSWHTTGYQQQEDYHREGSTTYGGDFSGPQYGGNFFAPPPYNGHGDRSSGHFTGYDNSTGSSNQMNNDWNRPWVLEYDNWNRGQIVKSDHDVWNSDYWQGLFKPSPSGW